LSYLQAERIYEQTFIAVIYGRRINKYELLKSYLQMVRSREQFSSCFLEWKKPIDDHHIKLALNKLRNDCSSSTFWAGEAKRYK